MLFICLQSLADAGLTPVLGGIDVPGVLLLSGYGHPATGQPRSLCRGPSEWVVSGFTFSLA